MLPSFYDNFNLLLWPVPSHQTPKCTSLGHVLINLLHKIDTYTQNLPRNKYAVLWIIYSTHTLGDICVITYYLTLWLIYPITGVFNIQTRSCKNSFWGTSVISQITRHIDIFTPQRKSSQNKNSVLYAIMDSHCECPSLRNKKNHNPLAERKSLNGTCGYRK